jgi:hypothetical protein
MNKCLGKITLFEQSAGSHQNGIFSNRHRPPTASAWQAAG